MGRVELRVDDALLAEWDAWRQRRKLSRTGFVLLACRSLMDGALPPCAGPGVAPESREPAQEPAAELAQADREVVAVTAAEPQTRSSVPVRSSGLSHAELMLERQRRLNEARG